MTTVSIVGHRDIRNDEQTRVRQEIREVLGYLNTQHPDLKACSLIASGADTIFYEEANTLGIPVSVCIPFQAEEYRKDFSGETLETFETIIAKSKPEVWGHLVSEDKNERDQAYLHSGIKLVNESDYVVVIWDGEPAKGIAGTEQIVVHAWNRNKPIIHIRAERAEPQLTLTNTEQADWELETAARKAKKYFTTIWITGIVLGWLSVVCYAPTLFFAFFEEQHVLKLVLSAAELICLPLSFLLLRYYVPAAKEDFSQKRIAAERERLKDKFEKEGITLPEVQATGSPKPDDTQNLQAKARLIKFIQGQIHYHYHKRIKQYLHDKHRMHRGMDIIIWGFFAVVALNFTAEILEISEQYLFGEHLFHSIVHILHYLWVLLPATYAAFEVVAYFREWELNIRVSEKMIFDLEAVKKDIMISDPAGFEVAKWQLKSVLENENEGWKTLIGSKHIGPYI